MLNTLFDDFIWEHIDVIHYQEDSRLSDFSDADKDKAVHLWLNSHRTWLEDIYPVSFGRSVGKIATDMLFGKKPNHSKLISNLFIAMAEDCPDDYGRDEQWWSEALEIHLDTIVNLGNFADDLRDRIYLYLEPAIEDYVWERAADLVATEERDRGLE
tara:strand:+ start:5546 stop:6016 length:471 start_codon:yes stop_codon:yes gene_type:complete